jgi:hypothetical protein
VAGREQEPAIDAVGRHDEGLAGLDHAAAQVGQAVVGRDEGEAAVAIGGVLDDAIGRNLGALEIWDDLGKVHVEAGIRPRHVLQLRPYLFAD